MSVSIARSHVEAFQQGFALTVPQIKAVLPAHIPFEKFERVAMMAVQLEPKLLQCDLKSLFLEFQKCAADGLLPDRKEAVITYRWNTKKSCNVAVYQPMIAGVKKLARNSGEVATFTAQNVYEGEPFRVVLGDDERIEHERKMECVDDNKIVAAYAVVKLKSGEVIREVMTISEIERARNTNKDWEKGPWKNWRGEMCRKTVGHRIAKSIPRSSDKEAERFHSALDRVTSEATLDGIAETPAPAIPATGGKLAMLEGLVGASTEDERDDDGTLSGAVEPPNPDATQATELAAQFTRCANAAELAALAKNPAVKRTMDGWEKAKPDLWRMVDDAAGSRKAELEAA